MPTHIEPSRHRLRIPLRTPYRLSIELIYETGLLTVMHKIKLSHRASSKLQGLSAACSQGTKLPTGSAHFRIVMRVELLKPTIRCAKTIQERNFVPSLIWSLRYVPSVIWSPIANMMRLASSPCNEGGNVRPLCLCPRMYPPIVRRKPVAYSHVSACLFNGLHVVSPVMVHAIEPWKQPRRH
ncbi:12650_t:CDS:2 [Acaulospora colombiana]|uniref:12650_t:CDS:1 n=1 Tax=Acaulospora colombiana TaxID=27376 RepID=A0ACA9NCD2_9GLOM|nr:12650_t:CDS:2 [Acaulospora colombiana]